MRTLSRFPYTKPGFPPLPPCHSSSLQLLPLTLAPAAGDTRILITRHLSHASAEKASEPRLLSPHSRASSASAGGSRPGPWSRGGVAHPSSAATPQKSGR
ncbi:hypothetical protein E2C01_082348 [Portunus trituberculatus]|uniref:Uncharacterized protein n=1 Tax=Portunus trituberculatus TaxID=210409 RepID=A0A5B7J0L5_PORTR|nr:hypothetical protein [Portunus trituberculatus]